MKFKLFLNVIVCACVLTITSQGQKSLPVVIKVNQPRGEIQPTMWGIFFEDINFAADGGIYAELVKNRSFEFFQPLMGWKELKNFKSYILINNQIQTNPTNPRYARITIHEPDGIYGISNSGFRGMGVKKDLKYHFSILARQNENTKVKLKIELADSQDKVIGSAEIQPDSEDWKKYEISFVSSVTDPKAKLNLWFEDKGVIDIDMVSLFPGDTWKGRPNGLRADLVQLLADLKPGFLRFPGGCIVEGRELATRYQWKKTIGSIENRESVVNRWNTEFAHRLTPDYFQSFGLGFYEYFQLCEDIGAEPLPILNCGMACQFNTSEVVPLEQLDPYIQDMLDLIEFANGSADTKWGKLRTELGHPAPFKLKMLGVGNEQWGGQYIDRYKIFHKILKEKHPEIKLISDPGPAPDGDMFNYLWGELRKLNADIVDEHYYQNPEWFKNNANRYDNYDRKGPKVFAGEYAAQSVAIASPDNKNNWNCALSEAAFITGLERNADVVNMASYAPLFAHAEGWQWTPDLIWFNNLKAIGSANYYVQKLFSNNKGDLIIPALIEGKQISGQNNLYISSVLDKKSGELIIKVVNTSNTPKEQEFILDGVRKINTDAKWISLRNADLTAENTFDNPEKLIPVESGIKLAGKNFKFFIDSYSFNVLKIKVL